MATPITRRTSTAMLLAHSRWDSELAASLEWIASIATKPVAITLLWAVALTYFGLILSALPSRVMQLDISHYYASAWALRQGYNPYTTELLPIGGKLNLHLGVTQGCYPPTFLLCFEPLRCSGHRLLIGSGLRLRLWRSRQRYSYCLAHPLD